MKLLLASIILLAFIQCIVAQCSRRVNYGGCWETSTKHRTAGEKWTTEDCQSCSCSFRYDHIASCYLPVAEDAAPVTDVPVYDVKLNYNARISCLPGMSLVPRVAGAFNHDGVNAQMIMKYLVFRGRYEMSCCGSGYPTSVPEGCVAIEYDCKYEFMDINDLTKPCESTEEISMVG